MAIESLVLVSVVSSLNTGLYAGAGSFVFLKWLIVMGALISGIRTFAFRKYSRCIKLLIGSLLLFVSSLIVTSLFNSYALDVSMFKIFTFLLGVLAIIMCFVDSFYRYEYWWAWFNAVFVVIIVSSLPLTLLYVGYYLNGRGFQGILNQPQLYGLFVAVYGAFMFGELIEKKRISAFLVFMLLAAIITLFLSESRTGVMACALGFFFAVFYKFFTQASTRLGVFKKIPIVMLGLIVFLSVVTLVYGVDLGSAVFDFMIKGGREGAMQIVDSVETRSDALRISLNNFFNHPVGGIGFGLASIPAFMDVYHDPYFNIPISAPVEKTNIYIGLLEESGIAGVTAFMLLAWFIISRVARHGSLGALSLILTIFILGMGEAFMFSINGFGGFAWILIVFLYLRSDPRIRNR
ncbi:hypothetical protein IMCC3135_22505 [Granulosicoccus antarcticus IMCC3135]|uniref:O-antigen ligase-related domain-containing protein n=2 Tax=Granulosicoccus TaxID=437504 RepID=A0A2Z2NX71_9GAMM|nr:hypothetical protein IMCC3135_22505 [Granulosicoccus antarcticus IMCC3135]